MSPGPKKIIADFEAEQSIIGIILLRPEVLDQKADRLTPQDFYRENHRRIFQALLDLKSQGVPVDLVTVTAHLRDKGELEKVGGLVFLAELSEHVGTAAS